MASWYAILPGVVLIPPQTVQGEEPLLVVTDVPTPRQRPEIELFDLWIREALAGSQGLPKRNEQGQFLALPFHCGRCCRQR